MWSSTAAGAGKTHYSYAEECASYVLMVFAPSVNVFFFGRRQEFGWILALSTRNTLHHWTRPVSRHEWSTYSDFRPKETEFGCFAKSDRLEKVNFNGETYSKNTFLHWNRLNNCTWSFCSSETDGSLKNLYPVSNAYGQTCVYMYDVYHVI